MNHNQAMSNVAESVEKSLAELNSAWTILFDDKSSDSSKLRALFIIKSTIAKQNTDLSLANELMQLEAQTSSQMRIG